MRKTVTFKKIDKLILFGGARLMAVFVMHLAKERALPFIVFSAKRHLDEVVTDDGKTLRQLFVQCNISYHESEDINHDDALAREVTPHTLGIALGAAWMFEEKIVKFFSPYHFFDFMGIDLPRYRGGAHYTWQILHGNRKLSANLQVIYGGAATFHRGELIDHLAYRLPATLATPLDFFHHIVNREMQFLKNFFRKIITGHQFVLRSLDESKSSYYPPLSTRNQGFINWAWNGHDIASFIAAFDDPYPGASTFLGTVKIILKDSVLLPPEDNYHPFTSGIVVRKESDAIFVATEGGLLRVCRASNEQGENIISSITLGDRLYTPSTVLDEAMRFRASYGAMGLKKNL